LAITYWNLEWLSKRRMSIIANGLYFLLSLLNVDSKSHEQLLAAAVGYEVRHSIEYYTNIIHGLLLFCAYTILYLIAYTYTT